MCQELGTDLNIIVRETSYLSGGKEDVHSCISALILGLESSKVETSQWRPTDLNDQLINFERCPHPCRAERPQKQQLVVQQELPARVAHSRHRHTGDSAARQRRRVHALPGCQGRAPLRGGHVSVSGLKQKMLDHPSPTKPAPVRRLPSATLLSPCVKRVYDSPSAVLESALTR